LTGVVQTSCGAHPASYAAGSGGSLPRVKRPGREVDHKALHPAPGLRMTGVVLLLPPHDFMLPWLPTALVTFFLPWLPWLPTLLSIL